MNVVGLIYLILFMCFLYFTCSRYEYWPNVIIYTIGRGLIPTLFSYSGFGNLMAVVLLRFVIGLIVIKLLTMLNDYFQDGKWFLIGGIFLEAFVSRFVVAFIIAFMATI